MNKKINILLRILGISILFLNIGSILGSAASSNLYIYSGSGAHIYIDNVYKGDSKQGFFATTLPALTTHTLKVTLEGYNTYTEMFKMQSGYMILAAPLIPTSWGWGTNPRPTPAPISTPIPSYTPKPTSTPIPYYTPKPTSTPIPSYTPKPTSTPIPYYTPKPTSTPIPYYTPKPTSTPAPTLSEKYIEINSEPTGAKVYFGTTLMGTTPFTYKVLYAEKITFKLPGYMDKVTYIEPLTRSPFKVYLTKSFI
jgi:hypothetical protein